MSYPLKQSTSSSTAPSQSGRYILPPQAVRSAISAHQHKSVRIDHVPCHHELDDYKIEYEAAAEAAYAKGQISRAELDAVIKRVLDASHDHDRRFADYLARERAGQTEPIDWFKEFYGYSDEEAAERLREGTKYLNIQDANRLRSQSRMVQQSRPHGRAH